MLLLNSWDVRNYMPELKSYVNIYRKKSQVIPEEILSHDSCPICMTTYKSSQIFVGECGHCFHKKCFAQSIVHSNHLSTDEKIIFFHDCINGNCNNLNILALKRKPSIRCPVCRIPFILKNEYKVRH